MNQASVETLDHAFTALAAYRPGSGRAALLPIDQAVAAASPANLEIRLLAVLDRSPSDSARDYIFSKLVLIGTLKSLPTLAKAAASESPSATAARTALEVFPTPEATRAILLVLPTSSPAAKAALLNTLGVRRDPAAASSIAKLLTSAETEPAVLEAALSALGRIASPKAARALRQFHSHAPQQFSATLADSILTCADGLLGQGDRKQARDLYALLGASPLPLHVRKAALSGLKACS